ncbi:hypothetical protein J6590_008571 [Homalodisca vitripennis]|nr:hypothetical protein J6590_008571 [Homalodisca vitripennis]
MSQVAFPGFRLWEIYSWACLDLDSLRSVDVLASDDYNGLAALVDLSAAGKKSLGGRSVKILSKHDPPLGENLVIPRTVGRRL